jgi:hypothetical protein
LGSASRTITFSSISSTYTDLVLVINGSSASPSDCTVYFNGSQTAPNYSWTRIIGNGTAASSSKGTSQDSITIGTLYSAGIGNIIIQIQNYSNTTTYKTVLSRDNSPSAYTGAYVGMWQSTAAINSVTFYGANDNISVGTVATLYGIAAA